MSRTFVVCSTLQLFAALLLSQATAVPVSVWHFHIDKSPAPAPEDGPPLSASAIRDKSYLPAQIGSLIGAYVLVVVIIGVSLVTVGRRLRRSAQASPRTLAMQMLKPMRTDMKPGFDPSPISPSGTKSYGPSPISTVDTKAPWPSPNKPGWRSPTKGHKQQPSTQGSVVTFDESVLEDDKARNQKEMERLYAAVSEHDEQMSRSASGLNDGHLQQHPPELQHLRFASSVTQPLSPPPEDDLSPSRISTTSPRQTGSKMSRPSPISVAGTNTHSRASSRTSLGSFSKRRGIRNLPISPPMGSPDLAPDTMSVYGEAEPLSPRIYSPGPPPPTPPQRQASRASERQSNSTIPSPRRFHFRNAPLISPPPSNNPTFQISHDAGDKHDTQSQFSGDFNPHRQVPSKYQRKPAPLALGAQSFSGSSGSLPIRTAPLPFRSLGSKNSERPASTIKATVLERKNAEQEGHLRAPLTGVPMTPYSPYMPFTPLTPMTPSRLVTREERKRRLKEEGRRVATIEDRVIEEADMWGDAYH
ncbi:hypothetical protein MMC24_003795 [Lignoscripta atroalba]|nr:hypothetical protein [Lignoscripta atroalba]